MIKNTPAMHTPLALLDKEQWLLGFKGGYVDEDNRLRDPDPSLFITKQLRVIPAFGAPCPLWNAHLATLCRGEAEEIEALLRWWGYCYSLTGQEQKFLFMWGTGGVGVTTTLEALHLIGGSYAGTVPHTAFMRDADSRFGIATLSGKFFVITSEVDKAEEWADALLVTATGSGSLPIEEKHMDHRTIDVRWGINFQGNQLPRFRRIDRAIRRRAMIAKFEGEKIENLTKVDKGYFRRMVAAEGPAILGQVLEARLRYKRDGLIIPARWQQTADEYFDKLDKKKLWREERWELSPDHVTTGQAAYDDWCQWHRDTGHMTPGFCRQRAFCRT